MAAAPPGAVGEATPAVGEPRVVALESIRGLACVFILVGHCYAGLYSFTPAGTLTGQVIVSGFWSLSLFLALSGYLMTLPFARAAWGGGRPVDVRTYVRNRSLRILPLYYVVLAVVLVVQGQAGDLGLWLRFGLFAQNYGTTPSDVVNGPMWSLVVELQFYLLLPVFFLLVRRLPMLAVALLVTSIGLVSFFAESLPLLASLADSLNGTRSLPYQLVFFVPGVLLALLQVRLGGRRLTGWWARADLWLVGAVLAWCGGIWQFDQDVWIEAASFLLLGACVLPLRPGTLIKVLDVRLFVWLGALSYGIYLWHVPVLVQLLRWDDLPQSTALLSAAVLVVSLVLAATTYRLVERPALRRRRRWAAPAPVTVARQRQPGETPRVREDR